MIGLKVEKAPIYNFFDPKEIPCLNQPLLRPVQPLPTATHP